MLWVLVLYGATIIGQQIDFAIFRNNTNTKHLILFTSRSLCGKW